MKKALDALAVAGIALFFYSCVMTMPWHEVRISPNSGISIDLRENKVSQVPISAHSSAIDFSILPDGSFVSRHGKAILDYDGKTRPDLILARKTEELLSIDFTSDRSIRLDKNNWSKYLIVLKMENSDYPIVIVQIREWPADGTPYLRIYK